MILNEIGGKLPTAGAELDIECEVPGFFSRLWSCELAIDGDREPKLDAEVIDHPFEGRPMVLRLTGGTQELQRSLYRALGARVRTNDFQGTHFERELLLESGKLKIRCTASREAAPTYQCWTLVAAELLD